MPRPHRECKLAIIGFGPRGLGALEALATAAQDRDYLFTIDIFDPTDALGAGPNFHPDEHDLCELNIPVRALEITPPDILRPHIAPFDIWWDENSTPETFPPRRALGAYLEARFAALRAASATLKIAHHAACATALERRSTGWWILSEDAPHGPYDEVLICVGQPATAPDPQLQRWQNHAQDRGLDLCPAYPVTALLTHAQAWQGRVVAIRGLGLSTHDVLRGLTLGLKGRFEGGRYIRSGAEPSKIIPFSFNGLAPAPKPATAEIDAQFDLTAAEISAFTDAMTRALSQAGATALETICAALISPVSRILDSCGATTCEDDIAHWLEIERCADATHEHGDTLEELRRTIAMARGRTPPAIDYTIGQIWRKLQNEIRAAFNSAEISPATAKAVIKFDEGLKRFSYGPNIVASEQLEMLIKDGLVSLRIVEDPDIALCAQGWQLVEGEDEMLATAMIDAVLPSPDLDHVTDPLIRRAVEGGFILPLDEGLGAQTSPDGSLNLRDLAGARSACLLGRLSLGSVIAADSLHDCFGASTDRWAQGVLERRG
jgi:uncharacterized NAD(P)/FAD-binding protein YdhS